MPHVGIPKDLTNALAKMDIQETEEAAQVKSKRCNEAGTHDPGHTVSTLGLCNGIFTDRSIFRLSLPKKEFRLGDPMTSA